MHRFFLILNLLVATSSHCSQSSEILFEDDFTVLDDRWKPIIINGTGGFGLADGKLEITANENSAFGAYLNESAILGHFSVEVEIDEDDNIGLALFKNSSGEPDVNNFSMITVETNNDGVPIVALTDRQEGIEDVFDHTNQASDDRYRHVLDGNTYSLPFNATNKKIRILRHAHEGFLHFYYSVKKEIRGETAEDWIELAPSKEWGNTDDGYFVALMALDGTAQFDNLLIKQLPLKDQVDLTTGFEANWRDYTWSGYTANGLAITFGEHFPFRDEDRKFVFWELCNYVPVWHMNNSMLFTNEFVETWGGGSVGAFEPMSDRLLRYSRVELIEDNALRKVVHWSYVIMDPDYEVPTNDIGEQLPEVDEYYTIYVDGSIVRKIRYTPKLDSDFRNWHELTELIGIAGENNWAGDLFENPALTFYPLDGEMSQYYPEGNSYYENDDRLGPTALVGHLKDAPDVFNVFADNYLMPSEFARNPLNYKIDWHDVGLNFSHWPIAKEPYMEPHKSWANWKEQIAHSSLIGMGVYGGTDWESSYNEDENGRRYREWISLMGLNPDNQLSLVKDKTHSWLFTGRVKLLNDSSTYSDYLVAEKLFEFKTSSNRPACYFEIDPDEVLINPVMRILDWDASSVFINVQGKRLDQDRYITHVHDGDLLVWIKGSFYANTRFEISTSPIPESEILSLEDPVKDISIFPNPILQGENLTVRSNIETKHALVSIIGINGQIFYKGTLDSVDEKIGTKQLKRGLYVIQIETGESMLTKKIIVK